MELQQLVPELEIRDLIVSLHKKEILHKINLTVYKGEMISLLGPSGCGKSTLLKTVAGLLEAQEGDVCIEGSSVLNMPTEKRGAVIVFQDLRLFPNLSVEGNIEFSLKLKGISRSQREQRVRELLEIVKLPGMQKRKINELSGGQMQRVALARALAAQPRLLLLDEPFSSLDEQLREQMRSFVQELHQRTQTTIVMVTHDREEALSMSDRIALMIDGQIVQVDVPEEIYRRPINKRVSDYFGGCSYLSGQVKNGIFYHPVLQMPVSDYADGDWVARILPGMVHLCEDGNWKVTKVCYQGESSLVTLQREDSILTARVMEAPGVGKMCGVRVDAEELLLLKQEPCVHTK
ncbi:MAG: ABC transporter ATP-binding protein [Negativibacillus massiliensis]|uniref:ABC transporter ATP-binding protein n=1 Tax=Negativibacillus massiliensis TaxID=1871035 RepID=UPI003999971D